jgi:hypothetical protein
LCHHDRQVLAVVQDAVVFEGSGGVGPSGVIGPFARAGLLSWVITARTPGVASASPASILLIVPAAMVDCTSAAWASLGKLTSDG